MSIKRTFLEDFSEESYFGYTDRGNKLQEQREEMYLKTH